MMPRHDTPAAGCHLMTLFRVHDSFHSHPAVLAVDPAALGLWLMGGTWCATHSTGGQIPGGAVRMLGGTEDAATQLVRAGLWRRRRDGFQMATELPAVRGGKPLPLCDWERTDYRRKIPDHVRQLVYERDEFRCVDCGATGDLTLDHIHPWSRGGPDTVENLRVLCRSCNSSKGARV